MTDREREGERGREITKSSLRLRWSVLILRRTLRKGTTQANKTNRFGKTCNVMLRIVVLITHILITYNTIVNNALV